MAPVEPAESLIAVHMLNLKHRLVWVQHGTHTLAGLAGLAPCIAATHRLAASSSHHFKPQLTWQPTQRISLSGYLPHNYILLLKCTVSFHCFSENANTEGKKKLPPHFQDLRKPQQTKKLTLWSTMDALDVTETSQRPDC